MRIPIVCSLLTVFAIWVLVVTRYVRYVSKGGGTRSPYIRAAVVPFAAQVAILLVLYLVEYDFLPLELFTPVRVLCWLASLLVPYILQVAFLCDSPAIGRLSASLRIPALVVISVPLAVIWLILGHGLFIATGHGLLFD
jgi:hypothetical protein